MWKMDWHDQLKGRGRKECKVVVQVTTPQKINGPKDTLRHDQDHTPLRTYLPFILFYLFIFIILWGKGGGGGGGGEHHSLMMPGLITWLRSWDQKEGTEPRSWRKEVYLPLS